jgi:hypothetical protein
MAWRESLGTFAGVVLYLVGLAEVGLSAALLLARLDVGPQPYQHVVDAVLMWAVIAAGPVAFLCLIRWPKLGVPLLAVMPLVEAVWLSRPVGAP